MEPRVKMTVYRLTVCNMIDRSTTDKTEPREPEEIHQFIMDALTEGRIDLSRANLLLEQCWFPGKAREL